MSLNERRKTCYHLLSNFQVYILLPRQHTSLLYSEAGMVKYYIKVFFFFFFETPEVVILLYWCGKLPFVHSKFLLSITLFYSVRTE